MTSSVYTIQDLQVAKNPPANKLWQWSAERQSSPYLLLCCGSCLLLPMWSDLSDLIIHCKFWSSIYFLQVSLDLVGLPLPAPAQIALYPADLLTSVKLTKGLCVLLGFWIIFVTWDKQISEVYSAAESEN